MMFKVSKMGLVWSAIPEPNKLFIKTPEKDPRLLFFNACVKDTYDPKTLLSLLQESFESDQLDTLKIIFYARQLKREDPNFNRHRILKCIKYLTKHQPETIRKNILAIPIYGSYEDLFVFFCTVVENDMIREYCSQLIFDQKDMNLNYEISDAAKYAPIEKSKYDKRYNAVMKFTKMLGISRSTYRKDFISSLRSRILDHPTSQNPFEILNSGYYNACFDSNVKFEETWNSLLKQYEYLRHDNICYIDLKSHHNVELWTKNICLALFLSNFASEPFRNRILIESDTFVDVSLGKTLLDKINILSGFTETSPFNIVDLHSSLALNKPTNLFVFTNYDDILENPELPEILNKTRSSIKTFIWDVSGSPLVRSTSVGGYIDGFDMNLLNYIISTKDITDVGYMENMIHNTKFSRVLV